jgi:hypothetical protein
MESETKIEISENCQAKPLNSAWHFWEHDKSCSGANYPKGVKKIGASFNNLKEFFNYFDTIPSPSEIFTLKDSGTTKKFEDRTIDELSMFKDGIEPAWEHPTNINGGYLRLAMVDPTSSNLDEHWRKLIFSLIGETLENPNENHICGIRLADKFKKKNGSYEFKFLIEIWFGCSIGDLEYISYLENSIRTATGTKLQFIKNAHNKSLQNSRDYLKLT